MKSPLTILLTALLAGFTGALVSQQLGHGDPDDALVGDPAERIDALQLRLDELESRLESARREAVGPEDMRRIRAEAATEFARVDDDLASLRESLSSAGSGSPGKTTAAPDGRVPEDLASLIDQRLEERREKQRQKMEARKRLDTLAYVRKTSAAAAAKWAKSMNLTPEQQASMETLLAERIGNAMPNWELVKDDESPVDRRLTAIRELLDSEEEFITESRRFLSTDQVERIREETADDREKRTGWLQELEEQLLSGRRRGK